MGWHGSAIVENNANPKKIVIRYRGGLMDSPLHLLRLTPKAVVLFMQDFYEEHEYGEYDGVFYSLATAQQGWERATQVAIMLNPGKYVTIGIQCSPEGN